MTKAMNINYHPRRDDFTDRLFSFLSHKLPFTLSRLIKIREHVFLVKSDRLSFILKAFPNLSKLTLQQDLTASLIKAGFQETYSFYQFTDEPLFFENSYYGCISYIKMSHQPFTFQSHDEREEGLDLLKKLHDVSEAILPDYNSLLPRQDLEAKWEDRFERFNLNLSIINYYVPDAVLASLIDWGKVALIGMRKWRGKFEKDRHVILHGDVAHHNCVRANTGELYLIDFDLVSIGSESSDILQYANRILPHLNWSQEALFKLGPISIFKPSLHFLYGLMYPSDIYREWNRVIRQNTYYRPERIAPLFDLTVRQFSERQRFIERLKNSYLP